MANLTSQGKSSNGGVARERISSSIFFTLKTSDNEEESTMDHVEAGNNRNQVQERRETL